MNTSTILARNSYKKLFIPLTQANKQKLQKWCLVIALTTPTAAILQGTCLLTEYRSKHGHAPRPLSPSRGIVVVSPHDVNQQQQHPSTSPSPTTTPHPHIEAASKSPPLRLLVIGDSLAAGVGTSRSGTPILPESIARALSKELGGRVVCWTCHGIPGANVGKILNGLESVVNGEGDEMEEREEEMKSSAGGDVEVGRENSGGFVRRWRDGLVKNNNMIIEWWQRLPFRKNVKSSSNTEDDNDHHDDVRTWIQWRAKMKDHCSPTTDNFDVHAGGRYDVAIVLTGMNDLKGMVMPFMLKDKGKNNGFTNELKRLLDALEDKMASGVERALHRMGRSVEVLPERLSKTIRSRSVKRLEGRAEDEGDDDDDVGGESNSLPQPPSAGRPMIVLTAMPAKIVPAFRYAPLSWFALPLVEYFDNLKRQLVTSLSKRHANLSNKKTIIFVESPSLTDVADYEAGRGQLWSKRRAEDVLLSLKDVSRRAREKVEGLMERHYRVSAASADAMVMDQEEEERQREGFFTEAFYNHVSVDGGAVGGEEVTGGKIFSKDGIHPNDDGYDMFGRHIAASIIKEWSK